MNIYSYIKQEISKICGINVDFSKDFSKDFSIETPKFENQGDVSTNLALVLSKKIGKSPVEIANEFLPKIGSLPFVLKAEVAGAGFINIYLKQEFLYEAFTGATGESYGMSLEFGKGEKINVEYCSANPTGPIHIGHTRGTIYGDVISELLSKNGFKVTREFYINDAGGQIETLLKSVLIRIKQLNGEQIEIPEGCYPGEYLIETAKKVIEKFGKKGFSESEVQTFVMQEMMQNIKTDLAKLKVKHDVFTSEAEIIKSGEVEKGIDILTKKGLLYRGILPQPKGKLTDEWEPREQLLFKATDFGDTEDRALKKSDGKNTYFTSDMAYHKNKLDRGFLKMILVLGADHLGYVKRITAVTKALSQNPENTSLDVKACQIVKFLESGEPVRMSKRKGTFTTLSDVLDEVSPDILRFILLTKKNDSQMEFDIEKVKEQSKENPIFYIQYAFSRGSSIIRNANVDTTSITLETLKMLATKEEMELIKKVLEYPKVIETAIRKFEPHLIANYLYELVSQFHSLWNIGNEHSELRFITENAEVTKARIFLVKSVLNVVKSALAIFKITPIEKM
jgi:arginyl-tRNA synthetase